jgi:hypothetical protein
MTELTEADHEALERALATAQGESEDERKRFDWMLTEKGWRWAAETAAYVRQSAALKLRPWEPPPCWIRDVPPANADRQDRRALLAHPAPPDQQGPKGGRLRLRGPRGAQFEFTLAAIAQNLRRLAKLVARPPPLASSCVV